MHVMGFGEFHHQRDRRTEHRNFAGEQEVIEERGPIHNNGRGKNIRHIGLHPREHGVGYNFEPFSRLQHSPHAHCSRDEEDG
jgi:hypothetical protein